LAASTSALLALLTSTDPGTIRRIIVDFYVKTQEATDNLKCAGRAGIIVADNVTATVGIGSLPKPLSHGDQEWLWNRDYAAIQNGTGSENTLHLHDDVRGMRKFKQTDVVVFIIQNLADGPIEFQVGTRILVSS